MTDIDPMLAPSTSPRDLAPGLPARIEAEHQAACSQARSALEHAFECGYLLLEAKAAVGHGGWLAWVRAHTSMTPRQAQRYMQLAQQREALEAKSDSLSHLTPTGALAQLATPRTSVPAPALTGEDDIWQWAEAQLDGPFSAWDFDELSVQWLSVKLMHHLRVPAPAAFCLDLATEYQLPALRLVSDDDLEVALSSVVPHATGTAPALPFDPAMPARQQFEGFVAIELMAKRLVVFLADEWQYRRRATAERLDHEAAAVHAQMVQHLDEALARLEAERGALAG